VRQDRSVPTRRDLLTFCVPTASARIYEAASVGLSFNTPSLSSRIAWLRHFVRKSNLCSQVFSVLLKLPFCPFPSKVTAKSGSIGLRTHFGLSCLSYSLPFITPFRYCQSPMEIAAVTGTEPSPEQFLHKRGRTRSWPPREKGIVYDPHRNLSRSIE
jgi:hypothetical protein